MAVDPHDHTGLLVRIFFDDGFMVAAIQQAKTITLPSKLRSIRFQQDGKGILLMAAGTPLAV